MHLDPYRPAEAVYECLDCGDRVRGSDYSGRCGNCGGQMQNISVPRE